MTDFEEKLMSLGRTYDVRAHNAEVATTLGQALEDFKNDVISLHEATVAEIIGEDEPYIVEPNSQPDYSGGVSSYMIDYIHEGRNRLRKEQRSRAKQPEEGVKE